MSELTPGLTEALINAYAKAKGISVEEARAILEPMLRKPEYKDELTKFLNEIGLLGDVLTRVPPESREVITKAVIEKSTYDEEDDTESMIKELRKLGIQMAAINAIMSNAFKSNSNNSENMNNPMLDELRKQNELLQKQIQELKEELRKKEEEEKYKAIMGTIEKLNNKIAELSKTVEEIRKNPNIPIEEKKSAIEQLSELISNAKKEIEALESIGIKIVNKGEPEIRDKMLDIEKAKSEAWSSVLKEHIGPAVAELIKDPRKLVDVIRYAREVATSKNYMAEQANVEHEEEPNEIPKLENFLNEVSGGGKEEGKNEKK